jgi:hypothetical protein
MIAFLVIGAVANGCATVSDRVPSLGAAYGIVIAYAHEHHLAMNDAHAGAYYCDFAPQCGPYFVVELLRHDETAPKDWVGSESVGWYGVDERDGSIVAWNIAQDTRYARASVSMDLSMLAHRKE